MEIIFANKQLEKEMNDDKLMTRRYGDQLAKKIRRRLDDLVATVALEGMKALGGQCEELSGNRAGQLSLRLDKNYRLIFAPADEPPAVKPDGGIDWNNVLSVAIIGVVDYH